MSGLCALAIGAAAAAPTAGGGAVPSVDPRMQASTLTFKVTQLQLTPMQPVAGQPVQIRMTIQTSGSGSKTLPWDIRVGKSALGQGSQTVAAGVTFEKTASWVPQAGTHFLSARADPGNTLAEAGSELADNERQLTVVVAAPPDWPAWSAAAWSGTQQAVRAWQPSATLSGFKINGPLVSGGKVLGPSLKTGIKAAMISAAAPEDVAEKWAGAMADAWRLWHEGMIATGQPWYPAFLAFPAGHAPPMPNVPMPLASLVSVQAAQLTPAALRTRLQTALGTLSQQSGAMTAVDSYINQFSVRFPLWLAHVQIMLALGSGPIPSFKPPYVPVGPVVNGRVETKPGVLVGAAF
jgi:hypothetical protein